MANRLQKEPLAVYVPAVSAVQERPAYCITTQELAGYSGGGGATDSPPSQQTQWGKNDSQVFGAPTYDRTPVVPYGGSSYSVSYSPLRPVYVNVVTCYPRQVGRAAQPARTDYLSSAGWNGGARSVEAVPVFGFFRATVRVLSALVLGLTDRDFDYTYGYMPFSFVVRPEGYSIVEHGITKTAEAPLAAGAVLQIQRRFGGETVYLVDGAEVYTSEETTTETLYAGALLYSLGDYVDSPAIGALATLISFSAELPALRALVSDGELFMLSAELPRPQLIASLSRLRGLISFRAELPALQGLVADRSVMLLAGELPPLRFSATLGRPEALVSGVSAILPAPAFSALLVSGQTISFSAELPALAGLVGDRQLVLMRGKLPAGLQLRTAEPYLLPGFIDGSELLFANDPAVLEAALLLVGIDSLEVGGFASITLVLELFGMDSLAVSDSVSFGQLVEMLAMEQVAINSSGATAQQQALQYAINAASGAPTKYSGFDFLSFVNVDGQAYGLKADGLYRIGDEAGSTELINALIDFGTSEFGVTQTKRVTTALLGVRTDGECYLRIAADDGPEIVYRLDGLGNMQRAKLAKGVDGRYWSTRLELTDLSFAKVDSIELEVGVSQRHSFGRRK
jgi:hypothetical protein